LKNVSYLFDKLDTPESLVIAIHYLWKLREEYPADIEVVLMSDDLLSQLVKAQELKMSDFEQAYVADSLQVTVDSTSQLSEMTPIKMEWKYAFVDLLKSTAFRETFARYEKEHSDYKNRTDRERRVELLAAAKANKQLQNRGYRLGIKHVVMVDPFYARINTLKKEAYRFQFTEGKKAKYSAMIRKTGDKIGVKTETLSPVDFVQTEVAQMNDYAALEEWVRERLEHEDFFKKTGFISPIHSEVQLIAKRHGTNHFGWSGLVWYSQKNKMAQKLLLWSIIYPFMLPVATYELTHPEHFTLHFTLLYDVSTGVESMHYVKAQRTKDLRKFTSAAIYYTFLQIKKAPKHK